MSRVDSSNTVAVALLSLASVCFSASSGAQDTPNTSAPKTPASAPPDLHHVQLPSVEGSYRHPTIGSHSGIGLGTNIGPLDDQSRLDGSSSQLIRALERSDPLRVPILWTTFHDDISGEPADEAAAIEGLRKEFVAAREAQESMQGWTIAGVISALAISTLALVKSMRNRAKHVMTEVIMPDGRR